MNTKPLWLLSAALLLSAAACQHTNPSASAPPAASAGSSQAGPAAAHTPGEGKESAHADDTSASGAAGAGTNPAQASEQAKPDVPAAEKDKAAPPKQTAKLYKLNPKSYDIVPIDSNTASKQVVLLTFDDGPKDHDMLESILTTLDKHKAKAIFFVNGYRVKQKPELLKLILDHGQTIGNHSWDHIDLKKESKEKVAQQIDDVQRIVKEAAGVTPQFFRPPFGSGGDEVRAKVKEDSMLFMTWSNGSLDWEMSAKNNDPDKIIGNVLKQLRPGSNILMHELPWTAQALDKLLTELEAKQYGFVDPASIDTVSE